MTDVFLFIYTLFIYIYFCFNMTPLCQITFVVLLISVVNVDLFLNSRHYYTLV